jgi:ubiquinone biosynthesis protein
VLIRRGLGLFGPDWIAEFEHLHSQVPALPLEQLRPQLREDLGGEPEEVFARFDVEPLAAGSIAQVHRAQLKDGTEVVVKIRRPGITEVIEADRRLLARLAALAEAEMAALKPYHPQQLVREFARSLRRELDLTAEAGFDRPLLARRGAHAVLKMIVEDGFFHADPHSGNLFYLSGNRIAFIDFGMVGRLSARRREELLDLLLDLVERQPKAVAEVLLDWTGDEHGLNLAQLESEIEVFVDQYHGTPLAQLHLGQMMADISAILREHHLGLPPDLALLLKAFISLEGMGRGLDPGFHMTTEALPLLRQVVRAGYRPQLLAARAWQTLRRTLTVVEQLPHDVSRLLRNARRGRLQVNIELAHLKRVGDQIDRAANRLAMVLVISALIIGASIVMTVRGGPTLFGLPAFGFLGFGGAVLGGLWLVRAIWRSSRGRGLDDAD